MSKVFFGAMLIALVWSVPSLAQGTALDTATTACLANVRALNHHVTDIDVVRPGERIAVAPGRFYRVASLPVWRRTVSGICRMDARIALASGTPAATSTPTTETGPPLAIPALPETPRVGFATKSTTPALRKAVHVQARDARGGQNAPLTWLAGIVGMLCVVFVTAYLMHLRSELKYWRRAHARVSTPTDREERLLKQLAELDSRSDTDSDALMTELLALRAGEQPEVIRLQRENHSLRVANETLRNKQYAVESVLGATAPLALGTIVRLGFPTLRASEDAAAEADPDYFMPPDEIGYVPVDFVVVDHVIQRKGAHRVLQTKVRCPWLPEAKPAEGLVFQTIDLETGVAKFSKETLLRAMQRTTEALAWIEARKIPLALDTTLMSARHARRGDGVRLDIIPPKTETAPANAA